MIYLAISRGSQGGWPIAIISKVASSVYSPSTRAKQPSLNNPSPGSSWHKFFINFHFEQDDGLPGSKNQAPQNRLHPPNKVCPLYCRSAFPGGETAGRNVREVVLWILTNVLFYWIRGSSIAHAKELTHSYEPFTVTRGQSWWSKMLIPQHALLDNIEPIS